MNRFTILKTSWGIAIFYEIQELVNFNKSDANINEILPLVFLRLNDMTLDETSLWFLKKGVESIIHCVETFPICFSIEKLQYNICDYQPEGMYYMFRKWFFENHNMEIPPIKEAYVKYKNGVGIGQYRNFIEKWAKDRGFKTIRYYNKRATGPATGRVQSSKIYKL